MEKAPTRSWEATTAQLGSSLQAIHWLARRRAIRRSVTYQNIDMRDLSSVPKEMFDFSWSSCSFEHLGSLEVGLKFLIHSMDCLKPGGIAVHTTEFNVSSNDATLETGNCVIYRRKDIEAFEMRPEGAWLRHRGAGR